MKTFQKTHNNLHIINDDIFTSIIKCVSAGNVGNSVIIPHVCNNINLFGAGFAHAVAKHYPIVKENFHLLGNKAQLGQVQFVPVYRDKKHNHQIIFANMIAQNGTISNHNTRPLDYYALCICMKTLSNYINKNFDNENRVQIHAPKFGSGLAGGNWNFIKDIISDIWKNHTVFIYEIKK
jgi:hypothetical protein